MNVLLTSVNKAATGTYVTGSCGSVEAFVAVYDYGVQVCCQNASHKVWRGAGKLFPNAQAALDNYKKPEMRAIINAAINCTEEVV